MMNISPFESLLEEALLGLSLMGAVSICNIYCFASITLAYRRSLQKTQLHGRHFEILRFVGYTLLLVMTMLMSLSIWVLALLYFGFTTNWVDSLLFTAGFFTTVGNFTLNFPVGWRLIPSLIAFSGLFSFAWATGSSMGMATDLAKQLEAHNEL